MNTYQELSLEKIQEGDLIYFNESPGKSNYDEYWEVSSIDSLNEEIKVKLDYLNENRIASIKLWEIRQFLPASKLSRAD
ncbi:MAG: hypothetical protein HRT61_13285 [Ekhidna sp.]|nr:hypothetical protein [Ekhidna sp.]